MVFAVGGGELLGIGIWGVLGEGRGERWKGGGRGLPGLPEASHVAFDVAGDPLVFSLPPPLSGRFQ